MSNIKVFIWLALLFLTVPEARGPRHRPALGFSEFFICGLLRRPLIDPRVRSPFERGRDTILKQRLLQTELLKPVPSLMWLPDERTK